jgi:hypothetical protein
VFVTSQTNNGDFVGGLQGADDTCQSLANAAGHEGVFKAWLSSSTATPATRFTQPDAYTPYTLVNGTIIAYGWVGLTSGNLLNFINVDETGQTVALGTFVYTMTNFDGTNTRFLPPNYQQIPDCSDWTSGIYPSVGAVGGIGNTNSAWTFEGQVPCSQANRLYCFQQ